MLTPSQKLREAEEDEVAAEDTPHHTSWGGRGRRGASGPSGLYSPDMSSKRKRAQVQPAHHNPCRPPSFSSPYEIDGLCAKPHRGHWHLLRVPCRCEWMHVLTKTLAAGQIG